MVRLLSANKPRIHEQEMAAVLEGIRNCRDHSVINWTQIDVVFLAQHLKDHPQPYDIGEEEFHLAFKTDDFEAAHELHEKMACICYENPSMGIYFIQDPDGYWLEIIPNR